MAREVTARHGWAVLAAWVCVWEVFCSEGEMLSHGFDRLVAKHPVWPRVVVVVLAAHVGNLIPARFDPVSLMFDAARLTRG